MAETTNLGKYLGIPLLHGRSTNNHYKYILENLDAKLSGWKSETLSLAGRVTLATSVLNALPSYAMQTSLLPGYICEKIDQRIRTFIWGSDQGKRKVHLVKWEVICKPKELGGLGLRSAKSLNQAFLLKIAWGILKRPYELWVELLLTKYLKKSSNGLLPRGTRRFSNLWRGVKEVWPFLNMGMHWGIGDGQHTKFWTDKWLDSGQCIIEFISGTSQIDTNAKVIDFVKSDGSWDMERLQALLPASMMSQVMGMCPPTASLGQDAPVWGLEGSGLFSVKTGYLLIQGADSGSEVERSRWKIIWNWAGPSKIRHFMWLVHHDRLMTNKERNRRHISDNSDCGCCAGIEESVDHALRCCPIAKTIWLKVYSRAQSHRFFTAAFPIWWEENLRRSESSVLFGITCWLIWRA
ncbi:Putative ribonuclease H protein At1g65750 [Linum perenne]